MVGQAAVIPAGILSIDVGADSIVFKLELERPPWFVQASMTKFLLPEGARGVLFLFSLFSVVAACWARSLVTTDYPRHNTSKH
jgi:hypothetical protein